MTTTNRRYDIDWVRVMAIGLLLLYHVAIGFQTWGIMIGFITNDKPWESLWIPMSMLNVWRIPLLFFISGMGVYFAVKRRDWKQLLAERAARILVPFIVGMFVIVPIHSYLWRSYYKLSLVYAPDPGHLWFLGNIFGYVILLSPIFYFLKKNEEGKFVGIIKKFFSTPVGLLLVLGAFIAETMLLDPVPFELYAMKWHGFFLGMAAFFFGFCFVMSGEPFWNMLLKWRWLFIGFAIGLFIYRLMQFQMRVPAFQLATESTLWIFSVLAFGYRHLNRPSRVLEYLSQAAYPVYILHMIFLYLGSLVIFQMQMAVQIKFVLLVFFTTVGCFAMFEVIRRFNIMRPLFGLRLRRGA